MRGAIAIIAEVFLILTMPSSQPAWLAPTRSWLENIRRAFRFSAQHRQSTLVIASFMGIMYAIACHHIGLLPRQEAIYACLFFTFSCALASLWALYSLVFAEHLPKEIAFRVFSLFFVIASLFVAILARSIADEVIQILTEFNPQEFSTAQYALSVVYSVWLWLVGAAFLLAVASVIPVLLMFRRIFLPQATDARQETIEVVTMFGLMVSSLFLISIAASGWASQLLESTSRYVLQTTSFYKIGPEMRKSVPKRYTAGRVVGDGDVILATDGKTFQMFCYRRRNSNCTADPNDEVTP